MLIFGCGETSSTNETNGGMDMGTGDVSTDGSAGSLDAAPGPMDAAVPPMDSAPEPADAAAPPMDAGEELIELQSSAWLLHEITLGEDTCGLDPEIFEGEVLPVDLSITEAGIVTEIADMVFSCERQGNELTCRNQENDNGMNRNTGHNGPYGDEPDLWEPELEWTCADCGGRELASAQTINGMPVFSPQGVCYDVETRTTAITNEEDCDTIWTEFSGIEGAASIRQAITLSATVNAANSVDFTIVVDVSCVEGTSQTCAQALAEHDDFSALPCRYVIDSTTLYCGLNSDELDPECVELLEEAEDDEDDDEGNTGSVVNPDPECENDDECASGICLADGDCQVGDLVDALTMDGRFTTLLAAVEAVNIEDLLREDWLTLFAPTDAAFEALEASQPGTMASLYAAPDTLRDILLYHVVPDQYESESFADGDRLRTFNDRELTIRIEGGVFYANDVEISQTDIEAQNGMFHVLDGILIPPPRQLPDLSDRLRDDARFTTLSAAVDAAGIDNDLRGVDAATLFAPTDAAFEALEAAQPGIIESLINDPEALRRVLLSHAVLGRHDSEAVAAAERFETVSGEEIRIRVDDGEIFVNDVRIIEANINAGNGIIHVLEGVLLPPVVEEPPPNLGDVIREARRFDLFMGLAEVAGVIDEFAGDRMLTVIAPTDEALFAQRELEPDFLDLLLDDRDVLQNFILQHLFEGLQTSEALRGTDRLVSLGGGEFQVRTDAQTILINDQELIDLNLLAVNGVVHAVNTLLLPFPGDIEDTNALCDDGIDNDFNGSVDCEDPSCSQNPDVDVCGDPPPGDAENTNALCDDGIDNDDDGFLDCEDHDCSRNPNVDVCGAEDTNELCDDGIDNDQDGFTDCEDWSCSRNPDVNICVVENTNELCDDGIDNDENGFTDCEDWGCSRNPAVDVCN